MTTYILDTNIASHVIKGDILQVRQRLEGVPMHSVAVSAITEGELSYGLAKRGYPQGLAKRIHGFLARVEILPWTSAVAGQYGQLRAACEKAGVPLAPLDMMIAAHARTVQKTCKRQGAQSVLVTRDRAFYRVPPSEGLVLENWADD